jgi:hypothetical protein
MNKEENDYLPKEFAEKVGKILDIEDKKPHEVALDKAREQIPDNELDLEPNKLIRAYEKAYTLQAEHYQKRVDKLTDIINDLSNGFGIDIIEKDYDERIGGNK